MRITQPSPPDTLMSPGTPEQQSFVRQTALSIRELQEAHNTTLIALEALASTLTAEQQRALQAALK